MKKLLCFGAGFSGLEICKHAKQQGFEVVGCVRNPDKASHLTQHTGVPIVVFDSLNIADINPTHIINTVPTNGKYGDKNTPDMGSDAVYDMYASDIQKLPRLKWFGYLSTTGVYGNTNGAVVNETTPTNPSGKRGKSRVAVEKLWHTTLPQTHIFRLPGIYGAGRSALDRVQKPHATAIYKPNQIFGRIHIYDIAQTVVASMQNPHPQSVYNVVDDMPCDGVQVCQYACDLLGLSMIPIVPYETAKLSPMAHSFYADSRRVSNNKIKTELGINLKYPTYKCGLQAIFKEKPQKLAENTC